MLKETKNTHITPAFILGRGVNALGIIRSLGRKGIPVYLFSSEKQCIAKHSRYVKSVTFSAPTTDQTIISDLFSVADSCNEKPVLYYASDDHLEFVSKYREMLLERFIFPIASRESVEYVSKKEKFGEFCSENSIQAPGNFTLRNDTEVENLMNQALYPLVIKPSRSIDWQNEGFSSEHGLIKVLKAENPEQLLSAWNLLKGTDVTLMAQEFIPGHDSGHYSYYSYRNSTDGEIAHLCVRKARVLPIHGGAGTLFEAVHNERIQSIARDLLEKLDYTGIASVCFKWNSLTDRPMVHEVNGRMPQGHSAFQICGIDLPYIMYLDTLGKKIDIPPPKLGRKLFILLMDLDALIQYRRAKELSFRGWLRSFGSKSYCAEFAWDDWSPFFYSLEVLLRRFSNRIGKIMTSRE